MTSRMSSREESPRDSSASATTRAAKPFSLSLGSTPSSSAAPKKASFNLQSSRSADSKSKDIPRRPRQLHEDDSDEDERVPVHEEVTAFDTSAGGAIRAGGTDANGGKRDLVIKVESKNNWRDRPGVNVRRSRGKNLLPREVQAQQQAEREGKVAGNMDTEGPSVSYGLTYAKPSTTTAEDVKSGDVPMVDSDAIAPGEERKPLTQDEIALQALIRESNGDSEARRTDLVIESGERPLEEEDEYRYDETSSFRADVASRPDPASLDAYNAIPVEEFGAALLRGMGWKEGQPIGRGDYSTAASATAKAPRIPERRPGFLGIGAKDLSGGKGAEAEIGAWGKAAMRKGSRKKDNEDTAANTEGVYMPVLMRSKKTGESITEEEFKTLQKEMKGEEDWRKRRDPNLERSGQGRELSRRDYDDDDNDRHQKRRNGSSRKERSRSSGDRERSYRRDDDDSRSGKDDRYYRDRDSDRDRDRDRDRDKDRDRHRDRDRDRDRKYRDDHHSRDDQYHSSRHSSTPSRHDRDRRDRDRGRDSDRDRDSHRRRRDNYR